MTYNYKKPIVFPNNKVRDKDAITAAFLNRGMKVEDISYELHAMWTWVLVDSGELWCLDKSHGGGGMFTRYSC